MNAKYIFVFATLGVILACSVHSAPQPSDKDIIGDLIKKVKELIEKLTNEASALIKTALQTLHDLINKVIEEGSTVLDKVKQAVEKLVEAAQAKIQKLVEEAEKLGVNIQVCLQNENKEIQSVVDEVTKTATTCVETETGNAKNVINEAIGVVNDQIEIIKRLPDKINECNKMKNIFTCLQKIISDVANMERKVLPQIKNLVENSVKLVAGLPDRLNKCAGSTVSDASAKIAKISDETIECINDKLNQNRKAE